MTSDDDDYTYAVHVLRVIAEILSRTPPTAALSHYPTLRIQTRNLNRQLTKALDDIDGLIETWEDRLADNNRVTTELVDPNSQLGPYRVIAPILVRNLNATARKFLAIMLPAKAVDIEGLAESRIDFGDFLDLGTSARQFIDALVETAYQLCALDPRQLNYKFLESLVSFAPVAPQSLHVPIYSAELQAIVAKFSAMGGKSRKDSSFTKLSNGQFNQRLAFILSRIGTTLHPQLEGNLNAIFKFGSDFIHLGYVSTLAASSGGAEVIMGGPGDAFTPRQENFAELKLRLLSECCIGYADLFLRSLQTVIARLLAANASDDLNRSLIAIREPLLERTRLTNRTLVEPIRAGLIGSDREIAITCLCGTSFTWLPPHHAWDCYCPQCGS